MIEIKSPDDYESYVQEYTIFLAGSLSVEELNGTWRSKIVSSLSDYEDEFVILNPERENIEGWKDDESNPEFIEHVNWVLNGLRFADLIIMNFDPNTNSPVSMMELGLLAKNRNMIVCCPPAFWKYIHVKIVCNEFDIPLYENFDKMIEDVKVKLDEYMGHTE